MRYLVDPVVDGQNPLSRGVMRHGLGSEHGRA